MCVCVCTCACACVCVRVCAHQGIRNPVLSPDGGRIVFIITAPTPAHQCGQLIERQIPRASALGPDTTAPATPARSRPTATPSRCQGQQTMANDWIYSRPAFYLFCRSLHMKHFINTLSTFLDRPIIMLILLPLLDESMGRSTCVVSI